MPWLTSRIPFDTASSSWKAYCFFFPAEDGIRGYKVTGVQTCALPIFRWAKSSSSVSWICCCVEWSSCWRSAASLSNSRPPRRSCWCAKATTRRTAPGRCDARFSDWCKIRWHCKSWTARCCPAITSAWTAMAKATRCVSSACRPRNRPLQPKKRPCGLELAYERRRSGITYTVIGKAYESSTHDVVIDRADAGAHHPGRVFRRPQRHDHGVDHCGDRQRLRVLFLG